VNRFGISLDAVTLLWDEDTSVLLSLLSTLCGVRFDLTVNSPRKIGVFWNHIYRSAGGSLYCFRNTPDGFSYRLALSGTDCSNAGQLLLLHFLTLFRRQVSTLRCSRLDIALDDYSKQLSPSLFVAAIELGNYSGFRNGDYIRNLRRDGFTVYLGCRQSEHFVRYYNKYVESGGAIDSYRFESEFKGKKSDFLFNLLCSAPTVEAAHSLLPQIIFGKINFFDEKSKNLSRNPFCKWWSDFVSAVSSIRVFSPSPPKKTSIESKIGWIKRQVAKSLATISVALGAECFDEFMHEVSQIGIDKMREADKLLILQWEHCYNDLPPFVVP
jgi:hypothetical protein